MKFAPRLRGALAFTALLASLASLGGCWGALAGAAAGGATGYYAGKEGAKHPE